MEILQLKIVKENLRRAKPEPGEHAAGQGAVDRELPSDRFR